LKRRLDAHGLELALELAFGHVMDIMHLTGCDVTNAALAVAEYGKERLGELDRHTEADVLDAADLALAATQVATAEVIAIYSIRLLKCANMPLCIV
jgi:hypothetical protein